MSIGEVFGQTALTGSMLLAVPVAVVAGLVSFASPCVVPLLPGYVGYVSGMAASPGSAQTARGAGRGRVATGVALFVLGFSAVFVSLGFLAGSVGAALVRHGDVVTRVLGVLVVLLGLVFVGRVPFAQRERRVHLAPRAGLWGAPVLGVVFGLGWAPCLGPTLAAVLTLGLDEASAGRGAVLAVAYCLGLGIPFVLLGTLLERSGRVLGFLRRHRVAVMRFGGVVLVVVGLALVTGVWGEVTGALQGWVAGFETVV